MIYLWFVISISFVKGTKGGNETKGMSQHANDELLKTKQLTYNINLGRQHTGCCLTGRKREPKRRPSTATPLVNNHSFPFLGGT